MSQVRVFADENIPPAVVEGLRRRGIDIDSVQERQLDGLADELVLKEAHAEGRAVLTHDEDFLAMHKRGLPHSGIIFALQTMSIGRIVRDVQVVVEIVDDSEMQGCVQHLPL